MERQSVMIGSTAAKLGSLEQLPVFCVEPSGLVVSAVPVIVCHDAALYG